MYVDVVHFNPLVAGEIVDPVQIVDVNGKVAWLTTRENISLTWEGAPGIFVVMGGGEDGERLLSVAREVRLVDEQTWQAAYHVEPGAVAVSTG